MKKRSSGLGAMTAVALAAASCAFAVGCAQPVDEDASAQGTEALSQNETRLAFNGAGKLWFLKIQHQSGTQTVTDLDYPGALSSQLIPTLDKTPQWSIANSSRHTTIAARYVGMLSPTEIYTIGRFTDYGTPLEKIADGSVGDEEAFLMIPELNAFKQGTRSIGLMPEDGLCVKFTGPRQNFNVKSFEYRQMDQNDPQLGLLACPDYDTLDANGESAKGVTWADLAAMGYMREGTTQRLTKTHAVNIPASVIKAGADRVRAVLNAALPSIKSSMKNMVNPAPEECAKGTMGYGLVVANWRQTDKVGLVCINTESGAPLAKPSRVL